MKPADLDLHDLRRALREHPDVAEHVPDLDRIDRMRSAGLLGLVEKLGTNPAAMLKELEERAIAQQQWSTKFPAFHGTLDFELTVEVLGRRVTRKARADYSHTPDWEYWDTRKQAPYVGWPQSALCITVRTVADKDGHAGDGRAEWRKIDILDVGEVWVIIDDAIEEQCRAEDAKRRRAATRNGARERRLMRCYRRPRRPR